MDQKFAAALQSTINDEVSVTENGAIGFKTSGKKLLDINFATSSLRKMSDNDIESKFSDAFYENPLLAVKWLFFLRDVRGGMGERRSFRVCFNWLAQARPEIAKSLIKLVGEYGRFDDLFCLIGTSLEKDVIEVVDKQWLSDLTNMNEGKPISLLAKWMPSINTSSKKTVALARKLAKALDLSEKDYRKTLSKLRSYLDVLEVKATSKRWNEINYASVPSQANLKYRNAFLRNDETRRRAFLSSLEKGETKINASTNFPCDIVHSYISSGKVKYLWGYNGYKSVAEKDIALEEMWKALPDYTKGLDTSSTIVVADGSGSMETTASTGSSVTALEVANSLAIYFAEKLKGVFKDKYITFSDRPQYVDFSKAKSLAEKLSIALTHNECASTYIKGVFDLILETAKKNSLKQEDLPANILVVSDMEFNSGINCGYGRFSSSYDASQASLFAEIASSWKAAGYDLPRLVYWNVCSRTMTIPVTTNKLGVALVSGFSPSIAKMVFSGKIDPFEALCDMLNSPRYQPVEDAVKEII